MLRRRWWWWIKFKCLWGDSNLKFFCNYPDRHVSSVSEVPRVTHARALTCSHAVPGFYDEYEVQCSFVFPVLCLTLIYLLVRDLAYMQVYQFVLVFVKLACHNKVIYHAICSWEFFYSNNTSPRDCMSSFSVTQDKTTQRQEMQKENIQITYTWSNVILFYCQIESRFLEFYRDATKYWEKNIGPFKPLNALQHCPHTR